MNESVTTVQLVHAPTDPTAGCRLSLGNTKTGEECYCVYRGPLDLAIDTLEYALNALKYARDTGKEPPITTDPRWAMKPPLS